MKSDDDIGEIDAGTPEDAVEPALDERALRWFAEHHFGERDENGVDVGALRANLKLTPTERLEKHQRALELFLEMKR